VNKQFLMEMDFKSKIKNLFLTCAVIGCVTCFQRADYNLPLFAFLYFMWENPDTGNQSNNNK